MLSDYSNASGCIPLESIDIFWRKLDLLPTSFVEDDDICCDDELEKFKESFNNQPTVGKKSFLRKLKEIFDPSSTIIEEPAVQINTCGWPSVKKQQKKHANPQNQAPRRHSCATTSEFIGVDLNKKPERHSCVIDLNIEPVFDLNEESLVAYGSLWKEVPEIFHPYITDIKDVMGDGNCGFRSIAACLGFGEDRWLYVRQQLFNELSISYDAYTRVYSFAIDEIKTSLYNSKSPALSKHWMVMPLTSILIANTFGVIIHSLSNTLSVTCFPLWKGPEEFQHHRCLTIAHVHGNHFVMVQLGETCPMPPIYGLWMRHRSPSADA